MPSPTQSEISRGALQVKKLVEVVAIDPASLKIDPPHGERPRLGKRVLPAIAAITFCIGVAATLVWQSRGDAARKAIASAVPRLGWLAPQAIPVTQNTTDIIAPAATAIAPAATTAPSPDQQQLTAMPLELDAVRQSIDRIAAGQEQMTRSVERIAAGQEQMARTVGQLTAGQEQLTREITKLQAIEQYILYKNSESPAPKPVLRPSQRTAR